VRGVPKTPAAALAVLLLAIALSACGGGDSSSTTTTATEAAGKSQAQSKPDAAASKPAGKPAGPKSGGQSEPKESSSTKFVPKHHEDTGGGSKQFRVKGGDNSIQEYGDEEGGSEFEAAAAALHDFLDARAAGDWPAACEYMSKRVIESFNEMSSQSNPGKKLGCAKILEVLINPAAKQLMKKEAAKADVGSLRVEGKQGFLLYTAPGSGAQAMPMENEGGTWKVASIAGTPLT
jgi:hypothetical protein